MAFIPVTPQTLYDIVLLCCVWDWNTAAVKAERERAADPQSLVSPFRFYRTTADKIVRILRGLELLSDVQVKSIRSDAAIHLYFSRKTKQLHTGSLDRYDLLSPKECIIFCADMSKKMNRARLLRDIVLIPTSAGHTAAETLVSRYAPQITRGRYEAEMLRQEEVFRGVSEAGRGAMMKRYHSRVEEET